MPFGLVAVPLEETVELHASSGTPFIAAVPTLHTWDPAKELKVRRGIYGAEFLPRRRKRGWLTSFREAFRP